MGELLYGAAVIIGVAYSGYLFLRVFWKERGFMPLLAWSILFFYAALVALMSLHLYELAKNFFTHN